MKEHSRIYYIKELYKNSVETLNSLILNGGNVWESNPPCPFVTGNTGFEVQEGHQSPIHSLY